ncbi:MAG TPA: galactokinase [Candidatus Izemoplasmatales bacterium]|nr:galactokinase [Bacillota bacterium]HRY78219.1 galactokinase [Candidatus Izemoplasmatales bacterium]
MHKQVRHIFSKTFGSRPGIRTFFSPGRVNLIGEHIDYNGGFVFPCALSIGNYGAIALREDQTIRFFSQNFESVGIVTVSLSDLDFNPNHNWANYAKGVIREMRIRGMVIDRGFDVAVFGDLPNSSGLSSSASIELLIGVMMNDLFGLGISRPDLAVLCKKVENEYIGVNCGIMDQFVIANAKAEHGLLLDCNTLDFTQVPLHLHGHTIVICNSKVKRGLVDSKYNERRAQCEAAKAVFQRRLPIRELCDLSLEQFAEYASDLKDDVLFRRARHAVTENIRTQNAHRQLLADDLIGFGQAMTASHRSLRDDYEVSCAELDVLVDLALANGAIGARMTGAGFGGCTVNLVPQNCLDSFRSAVIDGYRQAFGIEAPIYFAVPSDGTKEIAER